MLTDAHCHPFDLLEYFPAAEDERRQLGAMCAASSTTPEEFTYCEDLSRLSNAAAPILPCFAVHPQLPSMKKIANVSEQLGIAEELAAQGRLAALGETGFDLYNDALRETEQIQDELFAGHLELALRYNLPMVIHVRRSAHKIFAWSKKLKKCKAVIFHSWPCTAGEGEALLRRGINVFFSFGTGIMLNHREAMRCCAVFPANRLLSETDAPFQPLRGNTFSRYADLARIQETVAAVRGESPITIEKTIEENFRNAFGIM
jgi:TatD DNase family protein